MTICYFGDFDPEYSRNRVIIKGLRENGVNVLICRESSRSHGKYLNLFKKLRALKNKYDVLVVGYSDNRFVVPLAKLLTKKPIIWDAFYSLYDSWVFDRKLASPNSLKARCYWFADWVSCKLAKLILLDSDEHIKYFSKTFFTCSGKFLRVFIGADENVFSPRQNHPENRGFLVHFHGNFVPLQGLEYLVKSADLLKSEEITFQIIGDGQDYDRVKKMSDDLGLTNINWIGKVKYENLPPFIEKAEVCLGGFGDSGKARRVSMNKIFEYMASGKPIITGDSPGMREILYDRKNALLVKRANPQDLAEKILELKRDEGLRNLLAKNCHEDFLKFFRPKLISRDLLAKMSSIR